MRVAFLTPILNVSDVPASIAWFTALGWRMSMAWNDGGPITGGEPRNAAGPAGFAGVVCGEVEIFLCLNGQGSRRAPGSVKPGGDYSEGATWISLWLDSPADVDAAHEEALAAGAMVAMPPTDEPWGVREFHLVHPDGHVFRVSAGLRREPSEGQRE